MSVAGCVARGVAESKARAGRAAGAAQTSTPLSGGCGAAGNMGTHMRARARAYTQRVSRGAKGPAPGTAPRCTTSSVAPTVITSPNASRYLLRRSISSGDRAEGGDGVGWVGQLPARLYTDAVAVDVGAVAARRSRVPAAILRLGPTPPPSSQTPPPISTEAA
jgi:hypothetical protein